jgi:hypothetical protein
MGSIRKIKALFPKSTRLAQSFLAKRHQARQIQAVGYYFKAGRFGSQTQSQPDSLSRNFCTKQNNADTLKEALTSSQVQASVG